jgi:hypothetical protein
MSLHRRSIMVNFEIHMCGDRHFGGVARGVCNREGGLHHSGPGSIGNMSVCSCRGVESAGPRQFCCHQ